MGIISDLYMSDAAGAESAPDRMFEHTPPPVRRPTEAGIRLRTELGLIQTKNFTPPDVQRLGLAAALPFDVPDSDGEGPWLWRLPEALVEKLATADDAALRAIAEAWVRLIGEDYGVKATLDGERGWGRFLSRIADLARAARARGWGVYLYNSL